MLILKSIENTSIEIKQLFWQVFALQNKNMKFYSGETFITHCEWIYILNLSALSMFDLQ